MRIQKLSGIRPGAKRRAPGQGKPAGASFQEHLARTASDASSLDAGRAALAEDTLLSGLTQLKSAMLSRVKANKETTEEQEIWEKIMKYLDAWIESLREGKADIKKSARAYAALQAELTEDKASRKDLGSRVYELLTEFLSN